MPKLHSDNFGSGDMTWLASDHGTFNARTETIDAAKFADVQAQKGKIPAGYPVTRSGEKLAPYTGSGVLAGHILTDQDASHGDVAVPVFDHGKVRAALVPVDGFKAPTEQTLTSIIYL